jgi:hypothetical protein
MRELDSLVDRLAADLTDVRWPDAHEIRRTARVRRRRRITLAATLALVAVAAVPVAVTALDRPSHTAPQAAALSPTPERLPIPAEALLAPGDVRPRLEAQRNDLEAGAARGSLVVDIGLIACAGERSLRLERQIRHGREQTLLRQRPPGTDHTNADVVLGQGLYRLPAADAGRYLTDLRRIAAACDGYLSTGRVQWKGREVAAEGEYRFGVVADGFAGDESIELVSSVESRVTGTGEAMTAQQPVHRAVVRVGDLVTVIWVRSGTTSADLRRWSAVAARRMCLAANPGC